MDVVYLDLTIQWTDYDLIIFTIGRRRHSCQCHAGIDCVTLRVSSMILLISWNNYHYYYWPSRTTWFITHYVTYYYYYYWFGTCFGPFSVLYITYIMKMRSATVQLTNQFTTATSATFYSVAVFFFVDAIPTDLPRRKFLTLVSIAVRRSRQRCLLIGGMPVLRSASRPPAEW